MSEKLSLFTSLQVNKKAKDGTGIQSTKVVFCVAESGVTPTASSTWAESISALTLSENTYIWSATQTVLTDGTVNYTGIYKMGASEDFVSVTVQYCLHYDGNSAPSTSATWSTSYTPTDGQYLWTRDLYTWTDYSTSYGNIRCIAYFAKDGNSINVKGKCVQHFKNWTAFKNGTTEHFDGEDPYIEMSDGTKAYVGSKFIFDTTSDYSEDYDDETQEGFDAPTIMEFINGLYNYDPSQPTLNDAYMDNAGDLWVAGEKAWTNVGTIKGEKGDKGDAAEWYEVETEIDVINTDKDGTLKKTLFNIMLAKHVGGTRTYVVAQSFSASTDCTELTIVRGPASSPYWGCTGTKVTATQVTITVSMGTNTYTKVLPVVKDGDTGETGEKGDKGEDALNVVVDRQSVQFSWSDGEYDSNSQTVNVRLTKGSTALTTDEYEVSAVGFSEFSQDDVYISAASDKGSYSVILKADGIEQNKYTYNDIDSESSETIYYPVTNASVVLQVKETSTGMTARVTISITVDFEKMYGGVVWNKESLSSVFGTVKNQGESISQHETKITQNADGIAAQASRITTIDGKVTTCETKIAQNADNITLQARTSDDIKSGLAATGIDISTNRKITLTADNFVVQNNNKETTMTIDAGGNLVTNNANVKGGIEATSGKFGPLSIGTTTDTTGFELYSLACATEGTSIIAPTKVEIDYTGVTVSGGSNVSGSGGGCSVKLVSGYSGGSSTFHWNNGVVSVDLTDESGEACGMRSTVVGGSSYTAIGYKADVSGGKENHALYIEHGDIYGFRLYQRRCSTNGATVSLNGGEGIVSIYGEGVTVRMPSNPEDGMTIILHNHSAKDSYLKGATFEYMAANGTSYTKQNVSEITIMPGRVMILTYDGENNFWIGGQYFN